MITHYTVSGDSSLIDSTAVTIPVQVFVASTTGATLNPPAVTGQRSAITTIALCNTGAPDLDDETVNLVSINIYVVKNGQTPQAGDLIVSNLLLPAGETVFFAEENLVLDAGDELFVGTSSANLVAITVSSLPV